MIGFHGDEKPLAIRLNRNSVNAVAKLDVPDDLQRSQVDNADVIASTVSHVKQQILGWWITCAPSQDAAQENP
jgi:leucyl aminopeptidase (aminopeptidase T)